MVRKKRELHDYASRKGNVWSDELAAGLTALEFLIGPPVGSNVSLARLLKRVIPLIRKLEHVDENEFLHVLEELASSRGHSADVETVGDLRNLPLDEVERRIADPSTTKQQLLAIVKARFDGPTGTLIKLSREALAERIEAFVRNERTHQTLARMASLDPARTGLSSSPRNAEYSPGAVSRLEDRDRSAEEEAS